jgi:SHS2 domain-containing protein
VCEREREREREIRWGDSTTQYVKSNSIVILLFDLKEIIFSSLFIRERERDEEMICC